MDGQAHCGLSADGVPIVYSIPSFLNGPVHVGVFTFYIDACLYFQSQTYDDLMIMGRTVHLEVGGGADNQGRNTQESYVIRKGEISGIIKLVLLWHPIGHSVSST